MGRVWQSKFELEKPSYFGKHVLTSWASKNPEMSIHSIIHSCPLFLMHFLELWGIFPHALMHRQAFFLMHSHAGRHFSSCTDPTELPHVFGLLCVFPHVGSRFLQFPQDGNLFLVMISGWVSFPTIWLHFPIILQDGNRFW